MTTTDVANHFIVQKNIYVPSISAHIKSLQSLSNCPLYPPDASITGVCVWCNAPLNMIHGKRSETYKTDEHCGK